jgi:hypothetical protein
MIPPRYTKKPVAARKRAIRASMTSGEHAPISILPPCVIMVRPVETGVEITSKEIDACIGRGGGEFSRRRARRAAPHGSAPSKTQRASPRLSNA